MSILAKRLKEARTAVGLSQERLGLEAGLDPMSASARMNRYEQGKRIPSLELVERIANVLRVPAAYFYAVDDDTAELLIAFHRLNKAGKSRVMTAIREE